MPRWNLGSSVGREGNNQPKDCKLIRALLNVYSRQTGKDELPIKPRVDDQLISAIETFQRNAVGMVSPDGIVNPDQGTWKKLKKTLRQSRSHKSITPPEEGIITWKAEGSESGPFHSRILHVPSRYSGLTIGRGYDMSYRSAQEIKKDLTRAGVPEKFAHRIKKAAGKTGSEARQVIVDQDLLDFEITPQAQLNLFKTTYATYVERAKRVYRKAQIIPKQEKKPWDALTPKIRNLLTDLTYRGDYTVQTRPTLHPAAARNNIERLRKVMEERSNWPNVPDNRFELRNRYLKGEL